MPVQSKCGIICGITLDLFPHHFNTDLFKRVSNAT